MVLVVNGTVFGMHAPAICGEPCLASLACTIAFISSLIEEPYLFVWPLDLWRFSNEAALDREPSCCSGSCADGNVAAHR